MAAQSSKNAHKEAIAYILGRVEEFARQLSESLGIPYTEVADGISSVLAVAGDRFTVSLPEMRGHTPTDAEVLQPAVAVARRTRKPVPRTARKTTRGLTPAKIRKIQVLSHQGVKATEIGKRLHISYQTVYKYRKAA